ncbi:MAG: hypothetical protein HY291_03225 [Planctomycetes bacterium]|nr:hypothetical protein [Planctomycetota bacterium]
MNALESQIGTIHDPVIRDGVRIAITQTLLPAATEKAYPGHFTVTADGKHFGAENTWPGLDSWELAGAYLLLGKARLVRDYFAFVRGSQRADGNIPFAIFPGEKDPEARASYLRGMRWPEDAYSYTPPGGSTRKWIGLFEHWQTNANPLSVLGPVCYLLTAAEYFTATRDTQWLMDHLASLEAAARYVCSRRGTNGLIGGSGFYAECPPRNGYDGITQCYAVKAFRNLSGLAGAAGELGIASHWNAEAQRLSEVFQRIFWLGDHFAEYVHVERGVVDAHGLSDVNFGAIACGLATDEQCHSLWPRLTAEAAFWHGGMPTQLVARPGAYEAWELQEPLPFTPGMSPLHDAAAMGRVWWLETQACLRMRDFARLRRSVRLVCERGLHDGGWWYERYHAKPDGSAQAAGPKGYCEYAAVLARAVLGNVEIFSQNTF